MSEKLPVVAAIPNYNMAKNLSVLLPKVLEQNYDHIFVLDDASSDHSQGVVETFGTEVTFVVGDRNRGAGANRNRIIPELGQDAIIHFMDADTEPKSDDMPDAAREMVENRELAFAGGLVKGEDGWQHVWNYGPRMSLHTHLRAPLQEAVGRLLLHHEEAAWRLRTTLKDYLEEFPNPFMPPEERSTFWVIESNLIIRSEYFKTLFFDEKLREHEIQDLAIRFAKKGLGAKFDPSIELLQHTVDVRQYNRAKAMRAAEAYLIRKHGMHDFLQSDDRIGPDE